MMMYRMLYFFILNLERVFERTKKLYNKLLINKFNFIFFLYRIFRLKIQKKKAKKKLIF